MLFKTLIDQIICIITKLAYFVLLILKGISKLSNCNVKNSGASIQFEQWRNGMMDLNIFSQFK
jgi:hypothetical protein